MYNTFIYQEVIMELTQHAKQRASNRSVPLWVIEAIYAYGEAYSSRGCTCLRLTREALRFAEDDLPPSKIERLRRYFRTYVIAAGETIVTVAHAKSRHFN